MAFYSALREKTETSELVFAGTDDPRSSGATLVVPARSSGSLRPESTNHESNKRVTSSEIGEDARSFDWDHISASDRREYLDRRFSDALVAVSRDGGDDANAVARAEDALSALRPEMYGSEVGRTEHAHLEKKLEDAQRATTKRTATGSIKEGE